MQFSFDNSVAASYDGMDSHSGELRANTMSFLCRPTTAPTLSLAATDLWRGSGVADSSEEVVGLGAQHVLLNRSAAWLLSY